MASSSSFSVGFPSAVAAAHKAVLAATTDSWALFTYEKNSNDLKVAATGDEGLEELQEEWDDNLVQFAFVRVIEPISKLPKFLLISWCGDGAPIEKKGLHNHHLNDVTRFFKGFHIHITALDDSTGAKYSVHNEKANVAVSRVIEQPVGSTYEPVRTQPKPLGGGGLSTSQNSTFTPTPLPASRPAPSPSSSAPRWGGPAASAASKPAAAPTAPRWGSPVGANASPNTSSPTAPRWGSPVSSSAPKSGIVFAAQSASNDRVAQEKERREREEREARARAETEARERDEREQSKEAELAALGAAARARREAEERERQAAAASFAADRGAPPRSSAVSASSKPSSFGTTTATVPARPTFSSAAPVAPSPPTIPVAPPPPPVVPVAPPAPPVNAAPAPTAFIPPPPPAPPVAAAVSALAGITATVVYSYEAQEENEIDLAEGEIITQIEKVDDGWWQGMSPSGRVGLFPANYVEENEGAAPIPTPPPAPRVETPPPPPVAKDEVPPPPPPAPEASSGGSIAIALVSGQPALCLPLPHPLSKCGDH
ncbi:hypothetical protein DFJ73DRAFT_852941 [Zopfochytrium polystomum]|nr:hypothetical protein DFJ73DRAFT_852941 [Zopfochytrium polystomum]